MSLFMVPMAKHLEIFHALIAKCLVMNMIHFKPTAAARPDILRLASIPNLLEFRSRLLSPGFRVDIRFVVFRMLASGRLRKESLQDPNQRNDDKCENGNTDYNIKRRGTPSPSIAPPSRLPRPLPATAKDAQRRSA